MAAERFKWPKRLCQTTMNLFSYWLDPGYVRCADARN